MLLSNKYPFLTNYFTEALSASDKAMPQCILFYGNDLDAQFVLSKEIARLLNCQKDKSDDCDCLNCRWIREDSHPEVMIFSKYDNKPENDESKTVFSIKQSNLIKEKLVNSSEFHRVFIICDRDDNGNIAGLNFKNFQDVVANSMLKIIEEPHPRTTFIFLTRYIDDMLPTIISRSQCFFVPKISDINFDYDSIKGVFDRFWEFNRKDCFEISQNLQDLTKTVPIQTVLEHLQNYLLETLKANSKEKDLIKYIKYIEYSKIQANQGTKSANIFDDLCLKIIK